MQIWDIGMGISYETGDFTNLFESTSKKLEKKDEDPRIEKLKLELESTKDNFEKLRLTHLILEIDPDNPITHFTQIKSYLELDHPEKAFEIAKKLLSSLKSYPPNMDKPQLLIPFIRMCAVIKLKEKKFQESLEYLTEALAIDENDIDILIQKGRCLLDFNKYPESIECFKIVLDSHPDNAEANFFLGEVMRSLKKYPESIECYKKALVADSDNLQTTVAIGNSYSEIGEKQLAIECFDKVLEIEPYNLSVQTYRIVALDDLLQNSELVAILDEKLKTDVNNVDFLINKSIILCNMKKFKESAECFDKVLENKDLKILVDLRQSLMKINDK